MRRVLAAFALGLATQAAAQDVTSAKGAVLRGLDKVAGATTDLTIADGETAAFGALSITVAECRYPKDNPAADAYVNLDIYDATGALLFGGWMVGSSPALSALDHPRYDVWVLSCILPEAAPAAEDSSSDG